MYTILEKKRQEVISLVKGFLHIYQHHDWLEFDDEVCREHKEAKL